MRNFFRCVELPCSAFVSITEVFLHLVIVQSRTALLVVGRHSSVNVYASNDDVEFVLHVGVYARAVLF